MAAIQRYPHPACPTADHRQIIGLAGSCCRQAYGYRNKQRFITDIFFHLGGLDLYPANEKSPGDS
jgi:hypothetical protein